MQARTTIRETRCLESGVFEVELLYNARTIEHHVPVKDPWILDAATQESRLLWLFKDYPTKHPFDRTKAQTVATQLRDYGCQLINATHLVMIFEQDIDLADGELLCVDIEGSMEFQKLHWETMESAFQGVRDSSWPHILVRRTIPTRPDVCVQNLTLHHTAPKRPFNLLLVVARRPNSDDIDPFLSAGVLTKLCRRLCARLGSQGIEPNLEIARPGTWDAFKRLLELRTDQWHEKGGSGSWFDIVHFDLHGSTIKDSDACIHFLSSDGGDISTKTSAYVGEVLAHNHVATVFLNACESGYLGGESRACFAKGLIDSGVSNVLAMAYSLTNTAASILVSTFYTHLLTTKLDFSAASGAARRALRDSTLRDCRFGRKVELEDSIIPIVFTSNLAADKFWEHDYALQLPLDMSFIRCNQGVSAIMITEILAEQTTPPIKGRESDALRMELLTSNGESNQERPSTTGKTILLHGTAGVGKSEFARCLARWWEETNFIHSSVYFDISRPTFEDGIKKLLERPNQGSVDKSASSTGRILYILDHVDSKTVPTSKIPFDKDGKALFKKNIEKLAGTKNIVFIVSRKTEAWLRVPILQSHELHNLDPYSATIFASKIHRDLHIESVLETRDETDALDVLLCRLDYNPLAIAAFLRARWERSSSIDDCKPSIFLQRMLGLPEYIPMHSGLHKQVQECRDFVHELITQHGEKANIILSRLALTSGWFDEDWYRLMDLSGGRVIALTESNFTLFVKKFLLTSGWVRRTSESYQVYRNGQAQSNERLTVDGYFMHALLINALREGFYSSFTPLGTRGRFTQGMWWHFVELMVRKAAVYKQSEHCTVEGLRHQALTEAEAFSFLTAFEICLQDAEAPIVFGPNKRMWGAHGLWVLLECLHRCSKRINREVQTSPQTMALSLPILVPRLERVQSFLFMRLDVGQIDFKQDTGVTNVEYCMFVTRMVAEHYYIRNPMKAGQYIARCLGLIQRHVDRIATFKWQLQDIFAWLLVTLSYCYMYTQSDFIESVKILRVALQACRLMEQQTVIEGSDGDFDLCVISREDVDKSPYRSTLAARMYGIATLRLCAFKALRMVLETLGEKKEAEVFGTLEAHTQVFFFQFFPADALNELPRLNEKYGDTHVLDLPLISLGLHSDHLMLKSLTEPDTLTNAGRGDDARDKLLRNLNESLAYKNPYMEYIFLSKTIVREFEAGNWAATEIPIRRILEMRRQIHSGPGIRAHPTQITYDHAQYGAAMIQAGDLETALLCFVTAEYSHYEDYAPAFSKRVLALRDMDEFVEIALYLGRSSLISLLLLPQTTASTHRRPLEAIQYAGFDAEFCRLLSQRVFSTWHLSGDAMQQLEHSLLPSVAVTDEGMTNGADRLTFQDLREFNDKRRIARLLGQREEVGLERLDKQIEDVTANRPRLPLRMDLSVLQDFLPSQEDSFDMMPDYLNWWKLELRLL